MTVYISSQYNICIDVPDQNTIIFLLKYLTYLPLLFYFSRESYVEVQRMKRDIEKMNKFERLLLYLELPSSLSGMTDPLRQ